MLMEVAGKELYFRAISRTGVIVDKGTISIHADTSAQAAK